MTEPFSEQITLMAAGMGILPYQRFTLSESALFLRNPLADIKRLVKHNDIAYIQQTNGQIEFFGYQLIEYLIGQINPQKSTNEPVFDNNEERVLRSNEVQKITDLSRASIWRLERSGDFPVRLSLCAGRVGWRYSDVIEWIKNK